MAREKEADADWLKFVPTRSSVSSRSASSSPPSYKESTKPPTLSSSWDTALSAYFLMVLEMLIT
eukprot:scaffold1149_cov188-Chaetoceros_neogracile.AAC.3